MKGVYFRQNDMSKSITQKTRLLVFDKYKGKCAYCGTEIKTNTFQVDHINAKFRGSTQKHLDSYKRIKGTDSIDNLNPSCGSCNSSKSTFTIEQWRKELELKKSRIIRDSSSFRILERFGVVKFTDEKIIFHFEKEVING